MLSGTQTSMSSLAKKIAIVILAILVIAGLALYLFSRTGAPEVTEKVISSAETKPFAAKFYADLSGTKLSQGDAPKAIEFADLAIQTDPSGDAGYLAYAKAAISDKEFLQKNLSRVEDSLFKAIFLSPRKAEPQYWQGKLDFVKGNYDLAIKSFQTARSLVPADDSLNKTGKDILTADILFDESIAYFLKKDDRYKSYIREAYKYNPDKIFSLVNSDPALKKVRTALIEGNLLLMAKAKP